METPPTQTANQSTETAAVEHARSLAYNAALKTGVSEQEARTFGDYVALKFIAQRLERMAKSLSSIP